MFGAKAALTNLGPPSRCGCLTRTGQGGRPANRAARQDDRASRFDLKGTKYRQGAHHVNFIPQSIPCWMKRGAISIPCSLVGKSNLPFCVGPSGVLQRAQKCQETAGSKWSGIAKPCQQYQRLSPEPDTPPIRASDCPFSSNPPSLRSADFALCHAISIRQKRACYGLSALRQYECSSAV